jgi:hypothetical protein
MSSKAGQERGLWWWLRYVIVPLIGGGGIIAIIVAIISKPYSPSEPLQYVGRVIDDSTGKAIYGTKVSLEFKGAPSIIYTDAEGVFRFSIPIETDTPGRIKAEAEGYRPYDRFITLSSRNTGLEDIRLAPLSPSVPMALPSDTSTPQPATNTPVPERTDTPPPEPTPRPINTPVLPALTPTATSTPTVTPIPSNTPTSTPTVTLALQPAPTALPPPPSPVALEIPKGKGALVMYNCRVGDVIVVDVLPVGIFQELAPRSGEDCFKGEPIFLDPGEYIIKAGIAGRPKCPDLTITIKEGEVTVYRGT